GDFIATEGIYGYTSTDQSDGTGANTKVHHFGGDLVLHLVRPHAVVPYLLGGWTMLRFDPEQYPPPGPPETTSATKSYQGWEAGGGLKIAMNDRVHLRIDVRDVAAKREAPLAEKYTHNIFGSLGLQFAIGGNHADEDHDGVPNKKDKCPQTPKGAEVDPKGCPIDTDGDGVPDGIDRCAQTPKGATVDAGGCPTDSDGDGVPNGLDRCDATPAGAKVDASGCPIDSDGDGVPDGVDQCPSTPTGAKVTPNGCPMDTDGDGVPDGIDQCPNSPADARVDATGCPIEVNEKETQLLDTGMLRIHDIQFETGKWAIKPESYQVLDEVGTILSQWPQLQIEIGGHTDSRGSEALNQGLSERRAESVLEYLTTKFPALKAGQYTAKGYGETRPISVKKTATGRELNRHESIK